MDEIIENMGEKDCLELLGENYIGRLGFISNERPSITPITYFYDMEENSILSYAAEGHKIDAMRKLDLVSFQVDEIKTLQNWKSVEIHGIFQELDASTAKKHLHTFAKGVQRTITRKNGESPKFISDFSSRLSERGGTIVYRILIKDISGKYRAA